MPSEPFRVELTGQSLVVTFGQPCYVVSWAPLHGGLRSGVSHFLVQQFTHAVSAANEERLLRQAAGRLKLKGTVVGATADLESRRISSKREDGLLVAVLALLPRGRRTLQTEAESASRHSPAILVFFDKRLAHEAMLEAMALTVEMRSRLWAAPVENREGKRAPAPAEIDWVAVSTFEEQRYRGDLRTLRGLTSNAVAQILGPSA